MSGSVLLLFAIDMTDWFEAQLRYYQRSLMEGRDPSELREALAARRDTCLARLFDAATELHQVHEVPPADIVRFVELMLDLDDGMPVEEQPHV